MKVLFDTNVVLDVLLDRKPFADTASALFAALEEGKLQGMLAATTITTLFYLSSKALGAIPARKLIAQLLELFEVAPVNRLVLNEALSLNFSDYEDAVLHQAALHSGANAIVTRNLKDFKNAHLPIYSPNSLTQIMRNN